MSLEEQIIGAMLIDEDAYDKVCDLLQSKHFYNHSTRLIYDSMRILKSRRWPIYLLSVCEQLSQMGCLLDIGGPGYIAKLASEVGSSKDIEEWARCLVQDWEVQEELRQKYAGIELPRLDPQGDWVTVEELRAILLKDVEEFYKKLKCNGKKEDMSEVGYDKSKWIPLDEAEEMLIYNISREYDRIHSVELDGETGHYYPDRARMNPLEDSLGDVEIWVYNETNEEVDDYVVEPHFHVCKSWIEEKGKTFYEIDIEVKIKNIEQLNIWRSVTGNTSWSGLEELYNDIKLWLNKKAFDADITNKEAIRLEWNRNNMSNRIDKDEL